jgi:hypothetical protein
VNDLFVVIINFVNDLFVIVIDFMIAILEKILELEKLARVRTELTIQFFLKKLY